MSLVIIIRQNNLEDWMHESEWMNGFNFHYAMFNDFHSILARQSRQPKYNCYQKGLYGDKKHSFPKGMLLVGGFLCYKDSTRQRRVVEIP